MKIVGKTKKQILEEIQNNPTYGYKLAQKLNIPLSFIYEHLKELRDAGLIEYVKEEDRKKIYQLTEKGTSLLNLID
jgi:DNA-binding PadR family transcriptional regulator